MPRSRMRLDLSRFKRERYAAILVLVAAALTAALAVASLGVSETAASFYTGRLKSLDPYLLQSSVRFDEVINNHTYAAVMFEGPRCPICKKMEPYWRQLEPVAPRLLGVHLYRIVYSPATHEAFARYGVEDTPTFILFANGKPVARHVGAFPGPNVTQSMLDWLRSSLERAKTEAAPPSEPGRGEASRLAEEAVGGLAVLAAAAAALVAGVLTTFSPCVLPVLLVYVSSLASQGRRMGVGDCSVCGAAAAAGALGIAALFVAAGAVAAGVQNLLVPMVASAVIAVGVAALLGVPMEFGSLRARRGGLLGFCGLYGVLALQCTLPLVAGALLLAMGTGNLVTGGLVALSFAAGLGVSLSATLYAATTLGSGFVNRLLAKSDLLNRIGGAVMVAAGVYLLAYNLGLV